MNLKQKIKSYAYSVLKADLVGIGNIERCSEAPLMMSPQGLYPGARSIVVMGIHHPDACIELGGESHPQDIGPYTVQYHMNSMLDEISYRMASFLEDNGYGAIPICSSNIWRYKKYKELDAVFAPDVSNIYMPVVAGLADMGYNGLALTPEYGARNRFVTIITDARLEADELIPPGTICDHCMLCRKHCPTAALSKEIDGENVLKIENYEYRFPKKNLWRCSWGEHFDLDLDLEIPEKVTEEVILENVEKYGTRNGEMGQCLKFCVPGNLRNFDHSYSKTPLRKPWFSIDRKIEPRYVNDRIIAQLHGEGVEFVSIHPREKLAKAGIDIGKELPGAESVIIVGTSFAKQNKDSAKEMQGYQQASVHLINSLCYNTARMLEDYGHKALVDSGKAHEAFIDFNKDSMLSAIVRQLDIRQEEKVFVANYIVTTKVLPEYRSSAGQERDRLPANRQTADLKYALREYAAELDFDLVGFSNVARLNDIQNQIAESFADETYFTSTDDGAKFGAWTPSVSEHKLVLRSPQEYLPEAKSLIVLGMRYHRKTVEQAGEPPAEAVGPYSFQTYITHWLSTLNAFKMIKKLEALGHRAVMSSDLLGTGSMIATPRGLLEDISGNRFAAFAAGLGNFTRNGHIHSPEFGLRQRFITIVTDAEITPDSISANAADPCAGCPMPCVKACPVNAFSDQKIEFECGKRREFFYKVDRKRCDWSIRYALVQDSGFKYLGSKLNEKPEAVITAEELAQALEKHDPIIRHRMAILEPCMKNCPLF